MASTIIYRPILMLSSLASAYNLRSRDIPRHRSLSETTLPTSASAPDMSVVVSSQHTRSPAVVNLSRKKMAMAQKLMDEALVEDAEGWMGNDEPMDAHGDYVLHLFCMAVSSLLSALPTTSLARHPVASQQLRSTLLSASDQLHLGLASQDDTRISNPAAHAEVMDMKERVVGLLVWFMLWIRWSEIPMFFVNTSLRLVNLAKKLDRQYGLTEKIINNLRGLIGGPAFTAVLFAVGTMFSTFAWITIETLRRVAASAPPSYEAKSAR